MLRQRVVVAVCAVLAVELMLVAAPTRAAEPLEEMVVSGEQPGPGLWQVRHADNVLWILGTLSPLPAKMQWRSREAEAVIARSQAVIAPVSVRAGVGVFTGLRLLPAALRARSIPDGGTLATVLPPADYRRWTVLKARFLPRNDSVEHRRPIFAGGELYEQALRSAQLSRRSDVWRVVERAARRDGVPIRTPEVKLEIDDPGGLIKDFTGSPLAAEIDCFESLMTRVEHDLPVLQQRAGAWASGDVQLLRRLPVEDSETRCLGAVTSTPRIAAEYQNALRRVRQDWLLAAEGALLRNRSSLAVMPLQELLADDGLLALLRARGYQVQEPRQD